MSSETTGHVNGFADTQVFFRTVEPESKAVGTVLFVHGYGEHSGRYGRFFGRLADSGWRTVAFDLRGHGHTEGLRGFVLRATHCIRDIDMFVEMVQSKYPDTPVVLFGHSFGGALVMRYAGTGDRSIQGVMTTAMYLKNAEPLSPWLMAAAHVIDFLVPAAPIRPHDEAALSRDPDVLAEYRNDPLVYHGNVRVRTGLEILSNYKIVRDNAPNVTVPAFVFHGTADRIAAPSTTPEIFELLGSEKKQLRMYEGFYHELLSDPEHEPVTRDILQWLANL